ncbi:MAG TPA: hypothetical protein EYP68_04645 [Candidatus Korarchaeota archaeon]|nr:hypothetical protein [Candidatus Korarchaeota archaeon]
MAPERNLGEATSEYLMEAKYLELLKKLVSLNTDATKKLNYGKASSLILKELEDLGLKTEIVGKKCQML